MRPQRAITLICVVTALFGCALGAGCDETAPPTRPPAPEAPPPGAAQAPTVEQAAPSPWPTEVEGLTATVEGYRDQDHCVGSLRARMPVEMAELLADLGYEVAYDDACGAVAALKERAAERCDALSVSAVRNGCRLRLAISEGQPDLCPAAAGLPGRDPICLAWSLRDGELCDAAARGEQPRCRAVLAGDAQACRGPEGERCRAEVRRYSSLLGGEGRTDRARETKLSVEITRPGQETTEFDGDLGRGVFLEASACSHRLSLATGRSPRSVLNPNPNATLTVDVPSGTELPVEIALGGSNRFTAELPDGPLDSVLGGSGTVRFTVFEPERGGRVRGEATVTLPRSSAGARVKVAFDSYVRDLEQLPTGCAPPAISP